MSFAALFLPCNNSKDAAQKEGKKSGRQNLSEWKSFGTLEKFAGDEKAFADWEFKLQSFLRPLKSFEAYLDWIKERDEEITMQDWQGMKASVGISLGEAAPDLEWYDEQLYSSG